VSSPLSKIEFRYIILFVVVVILQFSIVRFIEILHWRPDLILIVLVSFSLRKGPNWGMTAGFIGGLLQDLVGAQILGLNALAKTMAGFIAGILSGKLAVRTEYFLVLLISGFFHDLIYFFFYTIGEDFSLRSLIIFYTIPNLLYTVIIGGVLYYFFEPILVES
jgi:rod shape-determining protein MreD